MKRHLSDSEPDVCDDYDECSSPDTIQISRKKRRGIIEKRRRDRINNCLMELRRLVPQAFEKQGSAKLEKAEILQMTVEHLRHLHQSRDPRGFSDPFSAYGNTRAFLDYRIMGFREAVAESARYLTSVEGMDMKDPLRSRLLNHLENYLAQRELAINAAVAASAQMGIPKVSSQPTPVPVPTIVNVPTIPVSAAPYAPLTPPRASPDNLSPPATFSSSGDQSLPRFSVAFPATPIISFASTGNVPTVFRAAPPSGFKPIVPQQAAVTVGVVKPAPITAVSASTAVTAKPVNVITTTNNATEKKPIDTKPTIITLVDPHSPTKTTKAPFRPWANAVDHS